MHPYGEVAWERRDVVMTNWRDGSIDFEQRGVEFPDDPLQDFLALLLAQHRRGDVHVHRSLPAGVVRGFGALADTRPTAL
ncbi:hypothetical protein GCM10018791_70290 [Streptomyces zaomyceticus]|nr:hypothetical protein GCM10018791_70290 [Streptomyces zaomyceticus]